MSEEDLIAMAREADLWLTSDERIAAVQRFASLVSARTREECARLVEAIEAKCVIDDVDSPELPDVASAIRAMGERT